MAQTSAKANIYQKGQTTLDDVEYIIKTDLITAGRRNDPSPRSCDNEDSLGSVDIFDLDSLEKLKIDCAIDDMFSPPDAAGIGLWQRPESTFKNGCKADKGRSSPANEVKQSKNSTDLKASVAAQRYSPRDILADITAVITADALNGSSEYFTEYASASPGTKRSSPGQPTKRASGLETSPGQRSSQQNDEDDSIDLIQLDESSLKLMPFDSDSASVMSVKSSDTLRAYEVEGGESSLCTVEFDQDDSLDSLDQNGQCSSILVEKGAKRGRPPRQKVERPLHYHPILPRPSPPSGQPTTAPYHVPPRHICPRPIDSHFSTPSPQTSETPLTASTGSRDSCSSDRDNVAYRGDASNGSCTNGSSRHSSSDTEGHHNARFNTGASAVNTCLLNFGSPVYTSPDVNMTLHTQIRPCLVPFEQSGFSAMNGSSYLMAGPTMYPSNMPDPRSTLPLYSSQYESGSHGMRLQYQPASADRSKTGNESGSQYYNPQAHPRPANHPSEVLPNNTAVFNQTHLYQHLDPSCSMSRVNSMQSPMNDHSFVPALTGNGAIGNHLNVSNHFSSALTGSNNSISLQNGYSAKVMQKSAPKVMLASGISNHRSTSTGGPVLCNISAQPTRPNEKPKLDLPYEKKASIVCQWINSHVSDQPPDSGCYPNQEQSFIYNDNNEQMLGLFGERIEASNFLQKQPPNSKISNKQQGSKGSQNRAAMGNNSTSDMSISSSSTPSSFKLDRANENSEIFGIDRDNLGMGSFTQAPCGPRPQSEFENGMSKTSIEEVEKINADLEIEINIIEMKEKSLENHKTGSPLPAGCGTKLSSLDYILLNEEADLSMLAGAGLTSSQFTNSSSFDRSKYLTPNDISSLEAKKHQSGKTSFDEYLGNAVSVPRSNESAPLGNAVSVPHSNVSAMNASVGQGHPSYFNSDNGSLIRTNPAAKESSNRSNSQHVSKPPKRKTEETKSVTYFYPDPACLAFSHFDGAMYQQVNNSRRSLVEQWINDLPFERNSSESQCFSSFQHQAQVMNTQSAQPTPSSNHLTGNWTESKMASTGLSNQHPVSTSDASMMSETGMSIENSLGQLEEHHQNALMNGLMDVVEMITTSVGSNERPSANCNTGNKQSMDEYHFNKVMNFLKPDIPQSMASQNALVFPDTVPLLSNPNSCNYLRNPLLQQSSSQPSLGHPQVSSFPCYAPSFDDGLILSPRGPSRPNSEKAPVKATKNGASNTQSPTNNHQPAEVTISSLDSSKVSSDSYLSKLSYSSIPEQVMGPDSDGETCLHFLCDMPPGSIVEIKQQPGFREALDLQNKKQETALFIAVKRSNVEIANFLLSSGANPNIICSTHVQGLGAIQHSALHEAVLAGNLRIVRALLSAKDIVVDAKSSYGGQTPLMLALTFHKTNKEKDIIMLLIEKKASLTIQETQGRTPLMLAIQSRDVSLVETILTMAGPVTARTLVTAADKKGLTCLHIAAGLPLNTQDKRKLLQCIIIAGGDASVKNIEGETPRDWAKNEITEVLQNLAKVNKT